MRAPSLLQRAPARWSLLACAIALIAGGALWSTREAGDTATRAVAAVPATASTVAVATITLPLADVAAPVTHPRTSLGGPTIKTAPTAVTAFDGSKGTIVIDPAAIRDLKHGEYVYARYGDHVVAHRVQRSERREDHTYVAMTGVDPVDGASLATYGSYHLYDNGTVSHSLNHEEVGFDIHGPAGEPVDFVNSRGTPEERKVALQRWREHEAKAITEGRDPYAH